MVTEVVGVRVVVLVGEVGDVELGVGLRVCKHAKPFRQGSAVRWSAEKSAFFSRKQPTRINFTTTTTPKKPQTSQSHNTAT